MKVRRGCYKKNALSVYTMMMLFSSVVIGLSPNLHLVYADEVRNQSLISDISDKVVNRDTNKAALQELLQQIQTQITQTSSQDKATAALDQIRSLIELNPNGPLAQSLLSLAKQQAAGNTAAAAVNRAATQIASLVASDSDYIAQPLEQAWTLSARSPQLTPSSSPSPSLHVLSSVSPQNTNQQQPPQLSASSTPAQSTQQQTTTAIPITATRKISTAATSQCQSLTINGITASGSEDPNLPTNAIDHSLNTRWSNFGTGSWIQADLGQQKVVCNVDVAWYRGNLRQNNFVISVSSDGSAFTTVFTGKSSGTSLNFERYTFVQVAARYVRITVNGNNENNWASITEINIYGYNSMTGAIDMFGIKKLYPSKPGGEAWSMNMNDPNNDPRSDPQSVLTKNRDGSWKEKSSLVRIGVFTSTGYQEDQIASLNQQDLAAKGYMLRPNDWKNIEMTGYLKVNHFTTSTNNGASHIEYTARGGRSTSDVSTINGLPKQCLGTTYHLNTYTTGRVKFEKDLMHTAGYTADSQDPYVLNAVKMAVGKWIGIKAVYYNLPDGTVKLEEWVDDSSDNINSPGNNWHKVFEFIDDGTWGGGNPNCGGLPTTIITWGGPIAVFRWDNIDDMDIKNFSVREIQAP